MRAFLGCLALSVLLLAGCTDPSEKLEGPGGCRLEPVVRGGTQFATDDLSIPIEAMAADERYEPRIRQVEIHADGARADVPVQVKRWHGKYGYGQTALFTAPLNARSVTAVLYVEHLQRIFTMRVPFVLDPQALETNKWIMKKETVRMTGSTATSGIKSRAEETK